MPAPLVHRLLGLGLTTLTCLGCDFFQELDSAEMGGTDTGSTGTSGTGTSGTGTDTGPCEIAADDFCADQDTLHSCRPDDGTVEVYDCGALCGSLVNFTCIDVGTGRHGCWCVEPGPQKVYSCTELEACLRGCQEASTDRCQNDCFARTTRSVIRMYGAVVHCAQSACASLCDEQPAECSACLDAAMAGQGRGCALERAVCDEDENDEPGP